MNKNKSSFGITTLIIIFPLITLLLYGMLSYLFFIYTQEKVTQQEIVYYEENMMQIEKNSIKEKVTHLTQFIQYYDSKSSDKIKKDARNIVSMTAKIANNLYHANKDHLHEAEIKDLIATTLAHIKFEGELGYLFLLDLEGNVYMHIDPKIIHRNILDIQDVNGKYIVKEFVKILQKDGEGFVDYYWYIVNENRKKIYYKISYVKLLDCYGLYVGAGEYLKYMKRYIKNDFIRIYKR